MAASLWSYSEGFAGKTPGRVCMERKAIQWNEASAPLTEGITNPQICLEGRPKTKQKSRLMLKKKMTVRQLVWNQRCVIDRCQCSPYRFLGTSAAN